jgi:hypothetical protein
MFRDGRAELYFPSISGRNGRPDALVQIVPGNLGDNLNACGRSGDFDLSVMNQLIAKVSSVPSVRQVIALETDRTWVCSAE